VQTTMNVRPNLILAASVPPEVDSVDIQTVSAPVMSYCSVREPAERCEECESVQSQPVLRCSNHKLRHIVRDSMLKVTELETACAKSVARNKELEEEQARIRSSNERMVSDIACLSTSVIQISARVDKLQAEIKESPPAANDNAASPKETDTSSSQPTIDQRVGELEQKLEQSMTRCGELGSAVDSIQRVRQRYVRRHSLVVENLCPKEEDSSVSDVFLHFVKSVFGVELDESDIDGIQPVDKANEQSAAATESADKDYRPRSMLITFTCNRTRTQVYKVR